MNKATCITIIVIVIVLFIGVLTFAIISEIQWCSENPSVKDYDLSCFSGETIEQILAGEEGELILIFESGRTIMLGTLGNTREIRVLNPEE